MASAADFSEQNFDYIIIGGGTTGLALASILSTNASVRVGVIEAGLRKDDEMILVPGMVGKAVGNPEYDWNFVTKPQPFAQNRKVSIPRGKVLGGSSALNYMTLTFTLKAGPSSSTMTGRNSASKDGVGTLSVMQLKLLRLGALQLTTPRHTTQIMLRKIMAGTAYVKTTAYSYYYDLVLPFFDTMNKLGVVTNRSEAFGRTQRPLILKPIHALTVQMRIMIGFPTDQTIVVLTGAQASKVIFRQTSSSDLQATAVEYHKGGRTYKVPVRREVIISTGALQTPQLLELSGIGNPNLLRRLNIPVQIDLPGVGENFQDHPRVYMGAELKGSHETTDDLDSETFAQQRLEQLSTLAFIPSSSFISPDKMRSMLSTLDEALKLPQIQNSPWKKWYDVQRAWLENDGIAQLEVLLFPFYTHVGCANEKAKHYTMSVFLQHAWSRGHVHATSSSVLDSPEIDSAMLDSPGNIDMMLLLEAVKYAFKIMKTGALGDLTAEIIEPNPSWSNEQLMDYIRSSVDSGLHPIGTASMLPRSANGVVDNELKVYGTTNLRVADASILPIHLGTHPQATLYGLAHKAAEFIQTSEKAKL
ncbi:alcohol oxidase [Suillus occidentalis]|nr:alcohol oxidase [Suillus occidentalis]